MKSKSAMSFRPDGRRVDQLRPLSIETDVLKFALGSALIKAGDTHVLCTASVEETVPHFLAGKRVGWLTADYAMLPASTPTRKARSAFKVDGRSQEIRRLIEELGKGGDQEVTNRESQIGWDQHFAFGVFTGSGGFSGH